MALRASFGFWAIIQFTISFAEDTTTTTGQRIAIGILRDVEQDHIPGLFAKSLRMLENNFHGQITLHDNYVPINRENPKATADILCAVLANGVHAILDLSLYPPLDTYTMLDNASIPYFRLDITVKPFVAAMSRFLQARGASDAVFIFQNEREMDEGLYELMVDAKLRVITYHGLGAQTAQQIQSIRPIPSYSAVLASGQNMLDIIDVADRHKLLRRPDTWNVMFLDFDYNHFMEHVRMPSINVLVPDRTMCCKFRRQIADSSECNCNGEFDISSIVLDEFLRILVTTITENNLPLGAFDCARIEDNIEDEHTTLRSRVDELVSASDLLGYFDGTITFPINMTVWTEDEDDLGHTTAIAIVDQFNITSIVPQAIRRSRQFYRIGITEAIPWTFAKRDPQTGETILDEDGNPMWEGYCIDMIAKIAEVMDFDYELVPPRRGTFGERQADSTWDGLVGDLMVGDTDMAVAALKMTAEREEVIDFIPPYYEQTGILIAIRNPVRQTSLFKFMTVLRLEVWLSIVAALFATAIMIWLLDKYSPYSAQNNKEAYPYPCREFSLKESFWFALTSFTPQGGGEAPKSLSGRTMVSAYWLFVVLMLATFTANLAAFLTVERMQTPVQSLDQLARQSRINYTVVQGSDTHQYFLNMKFAEDTLYRVWKEITLNSTHDQARYRVWEYPIREQYGQILMAIEAAGTVQSAEEGFRQVNRHENADYAFIHDSAEIKYEISRNCNLTEVGEVFAEQPYAIGIQQGSNLQDDLTRTVLRLQRERYFDELTAKFWNHSAKGECVNTDDNEGITLESLGGVFIATLFGLALSMVTLVGEVLYYRRKDHRQTSDVARMVQPIDSATTKKRPFTVDTPPPPFDDEHPITFGREFVPASQTRPAYISVYPRRAIHDSDPNHVD